MGSLPNSQPVAVCCTSSGAWVGGGSILSIMSYSVPLAVPSASSSALANLSSLALLTCTRNWHLFFSDHMGMVHGGVLKTI